MPDVTIDDTLRDTWSAIQARGTEGDFAEPAQPEEPVELVESAEPVDEAAPEQEEQEQPEEVAEPEETEPSKTAGFRPPWKKAALADWDKLPESARKEIERRENDFHRGIEQYKAGVQASQEWERTVQPYLATINSFGVTPQVAAAELFKADHLLRYSDPPQKVQMLLKIAGNYGVDLQTLANGIQQQAGEQVWQQQNPVDPRVQQLEARVGQLTQHITTTQQQAMQAEHSAIDSEIAAFAADPDHEHFGLLQKDMAVLLQNGMAKDLDSAYDMAMRQNPQTYQIWLAQQQQEWDAQRKAQVEKAKKANANNVRPNGRASVAKASANETMEQTLERVAREQGLIN